MKTKELSHEAKQMLNHYYNNNQVWFATSVLRGEIENSHTCYIDEIVTPTLLEIAKQKLQEEKINSTKDAARRILIEKYGNSPVRFAERLLQGKISYDEARYIKHIVTDEVMEAAKWRLINPKIL